MKNLLTKLEAEGIRLSLSFDGNLEATGDKEAVEKYLPMLRQRKAEVIATLKNPSWCAGSTCTAYEEINLTREGKTPGCVLREPDMETWRRLDRMAACPLWN